MKDSFKFCNNQKHKCLFKNKYDHNKVYGDCDEADHSKEGKIRIFWCKRCSELGGKKQMVFETDDTKHEHEQLEEIHYDEVLTKRRDLN